MKVAGVERVEAVHTDHESDGEVANEDSEPNRFLGVLAATAMGMCLGFFFEKSHCYEPANIQGQFVFQRWVMLKMFLGAVAGSCIVFSVLSLVAPEKFAAVRRSFLPGCAGRGWVTGGVFGASLLGAGMYLAGACPGMVLPQVGTGVPNAMLTLGGGLAGTLVYGLLEPALRPGFLEKGEQCTGDEEECFADLRWGGGAGPPFAALSLLLGGMCAAIALALEVLVPFLGEVGSITAAEESNNSSSSSSSAGNNPFLAKAWPPSLCGFLLGLLQLPCALFLQDSLGSTTAYQCITSQWLWLVPGARGRFAYMDRFLCAGIGVWWQVFYVGAAVLGAFLSALLSDSFPSSASGVEPPLQAFLGGILMVFGSRTAGGCTSGHGISGMPLLHGLSILAVCSMFASGIALGFLMGR